jgi:hypothetical protein
VLEVTATNLEYNQPALRIRQASSRGGAASIRIDDPIRILSSSKPNRIQTIRQRESTVAVQSDKFQINGRNATNSGFETVLVIQRLAAGGNIGFRTSSQFGGARGVVAIANAAVAPSVNPLDGGILYVENGALKYRGSEGTITVIAPA